MSLKSNLNQIIRDMNGEIFTITALEAYCKKAGYKLSNAERRLRPSESLDIIRVMKKGYIIGYKYEAKANTTSSEKENIFKQTEKIKVSNHSQKRSGQMRPLWNDGGTISGPYISHRPIPSYGMDDN